MYMAQQLGKRLAWEPISTLTEFAKGASASLTNQQLHLWHVPLLLDAGQTALALKLLNDHQREKYERRREPSQQRAYLAGRYYLISLLSIYTQTPMDQVKLAYSRLNKPSLVDNPIDLQFNYTDTRLDPNSIDQSNVGLFALCLGAEVGVDIEARARSARFDEISAKRFTTAELEYVKSAKTRGASKDKPPIDSERCLAMWTRKEAYGKATGKGINFAMNEQNLISTDQPYELNFSDANAAWRLNQIEIGDHLIACVVHAGHQALALKTFSLAEPSAR